MQTDFTRRSFLTLGETADAGVSCVDIDRENKTGEYILSGKGYSSEILISAKPESVFKAITKDIDKWWTELSNQTLQVGDKLVVRFEKTTSWVMTVSEILQDRSLVWKVAEANHDLEGITKKDEWKGKSGDSIPIN